jgi:integrase
MARRPRAARLEHRSNRLKLPVRKKPHDFTVIAPGILVGYRRCKGPGRFVEKVADGNGGYWTKVVGIADDYEPADGEHILDWWQAIDKARALARGQDNSGRPATVADALDDYERDLTARDADINNARRARHHLTPTLLAKPVSLLTAREWRRWRDGLKLKRSTLNRTLRPIKAALNLAAAHDPRIANREAWRVGLAGLPDSHRARNVILTDDEVRALIVEAHRINHEFGLLTEVLAGTGARVSQAARLEVGDLQDNRRDPRLMMPSSKKGRGKKRIGRKPVPITASLAAKLRQAAGDRPNDAPLLLNPNGTAWATERSEHLRPFALAVERAGLASNVTAYALRHSSIVRQLLAAVPIRVTADVHDTSIMMIERNYSEFIGEHSDALVRRALLDAEPSAADNNVVVALKGQGR